MPGMWSHDLFWKLFLLKTQVTKLKFERHKSGKGAIV